MMIRSPPRLYRSPKNCILKKAMFISALKPYNTLLSCGSYIWNYCMKWMDRVDTAFSIHTIPTVLHDR